MPKEEELEFLEHVDDNNGDDGNMTTNHSRAVDGLGAGGESGVR